MSGSDACHMHHSRISCRHVRLRYSEGYSPTSTLWQRWSYYYLTPVRPNRPLRHPGLLPRDAYAINSVCPVIILPSLITSAPELPPGSILGLRQGHFNPAILPPPALRLIGGAGPTLAIALGEQALGRQGKM